VPDLCHSRLKIGAAKAVDSFSLCLPTDVRVPFLHRSRYVSCEAITIESEACLGWDAPSGFDAKWCERRKYHRGATCQRLVWAGRLRFCSLCLSRSRSRLGYWASLHAQLVDSRVAWSTW